MLQFTITTDYDGKFSGPSSIKLSSASNDVHDIEVAEIWMAIKDGRFEEKAKEMLERGMPPAIVSPAMIAERSKSLPVWAWPSGSSHVYLLWLSSFSWFPRSLCRIPFGWRPARRSFKAS